MLQACSDILCVAAQNVPAKASQSIALAAFAVRGLPPVFRIILCWHEIGESNCKFKRQMSKERCLISTVFLPVTQEWPSCGEAEAPVAEGSFSFTACRFLLAATGWPRSRVLLDTLPLQLWRLKVQQCSRGRGAPGSSRGDPHAHSSWATWAEGLWLLVLGPLLVQPTPGCLSAVWQCWLSGKQPSPAETAWSNKMDPKRLVF